MKVCLPLSLTIDCALFASSGRAKFADRVLLTTRSPASMAAGSSVAQYFPSRYSSTKTGTLAPTFTLRTKSLRTTFPAKIDVVFASKSGMSFPSEGNRHLDLVEACQFCTARRIEEHDTHGLFGDLFEDHHGDGVHGNLSGIVLHHREMNLTRGIFEAIRGTHRL